ncbi:hypothetical protein [Novosphingobium sp. FKTRR1]|uniref:hypothetical protein n=1 Tax=Novosphingobium sp. FKTRR1 TaxID=2879118 RepID=UPI001CF09DA6|nr:hypothetical protein [Novosphingobium sp. FKTRR1]
MTTPTPFSDLSALDHVAARISADDARSCDCREPAAPRHELSRSARTLLWLFGEPRDRPLALANPRLEAIRRFVCATRAGHQPGTVLISQLQTRGVQPQRLAELASLLT